MVQNIYHFSDIGNGWQPAILETEEEHNFIKEVQKSFINSVPYWIGGSTDIDIERYLWFNFPNYIGDNTGSKLFICYFYFGMLKCFAYFQ